MKKSIKLIFIIIAFCLLGLVILWLSGFFHATIPPEQIAVQSSPPEGQRYIVVSVIEPTFETATGTINARDETTVSSRILAAIQTVSVRAGDTVKNGDTLIELDDRELKARLEQADQMVSSGAAAYQQAQAEYDRISALYQRKVVSRAEYDRTDAQLKTRQAEHQRSQRQLEEARTALSFTKISSPIDGKVVERYADPGDTATPGLPLIKIYNPSLLRLDAHVRESLSSGIHLGDGLSAYIDAIQKQVTVIVDEIVPSADPGSRSVTVKSILPTGEPLYPGMFGRLLIPTGEVSRIYIPDNAVARMGQLEFVDIIENDRAVKRFIRTGRRNNYNQVEVVSGLQAGETILLRE